ncbi:hypothetical protein MVEG_02645 [Podila verticillata NRRL 6337]|nr:hypothetical protein MVEG_02645 [Podila verticillata NRRL 6337]
MTMDPINGVGIKRFMNLQPRETAMNMEYNDSDEDSDGYMSSEFKAQRRSTQELVDFFNNNTPAPRPAPSLPPIFEDEKKKPTLLQRLRPKKPGQSGPSTFYPTQQQPLSPGSNSTLNLNPSEGATLPNGKKYVMIAVDYKDKDKVPSSAIGVRTSGTKSLELTRTTGGTQGGGEDILSARDSIFIPRQVMAKIEDTRDQTSDKRSTYRSSGEDVLFFLDNSPFLLDNFTLDNFSLDGDFVVSPTTADSNSDSSQRHPRRQTLDYTQYVPSTQYVPRHKRATSESQPVVEQVQVEQERRAPKRGNKVTFSIDTERHPSNDEDSLSKILSQRIASHKEQQAKNESMMTETDILIPEPSSPSSPSETSTSSSSHSGHNLEIVLPKSSSRKKVRHVQIQTQHCLMRPTFTQTSPADVAGQNVQAQEWGTQTTQGRNEMGTSTSTEDDSKHVSPKEFKSTNVSAPIAPLAKWRTATELSQQEREELVQLRAKTAQLQAQVASLQRDLSTEIRSRTRAAVAMQDTRDKFEMLSAMAYKKLKEMVYQRHVLEMEVRELRAQVDIQAAEDELMHHPSAPSRRPSCDTQQPQPQSPSQQHQQQHHQQQQRQQQAQTAF